LLHKETPEFIPPHLWPPNLLDLNPVYQGVWGLLQEQVHKICITDLNKLKQRLRSENGVGQLDHVVIAVAIRQWRRQCSRSVMSVLYTISCNIFHALLSTGFKDGEFGVKVG